MPDQLVCTKCWKWYDGRTLCPTCRLPLVSPDTGKPLPELEAPAVVTPVAAPPAWPAGGELPVVAGETFVETPLPRMSGYPTGTPLTPPTRLEVQRYLSDNPAAGSVARGPLAARMALPVPAPAAAPAPPEQPPPSLPPPPAGPAQANPDAGPRPALSSLGPRFSPLGPPFPPPIAAPSAGPEAGPSPAASWTVRPPGSPAWPPSPVGSGGPPAGRVPLTPGAGLRGFGVTAPTAAPGRTEALPLGWHPGVSLGRPLAAAPASPVPPAGAPASEESQMAEFAVPMSRPLPSPPPAPPEPPSRFATLRSVDRPPTPPPAPPPAPLTRVWPGVSEATEPPMAREAAAEAAALAVPAPPPLSPLAARTPPAPPATAPISAIAPVPAAAATPVAAAAIAPGSAVDPISNAVVAPVTPAPSSVEVPPESPPAGVSSTPVAISDAAIASDAVRPAAPPAPPQPPPPATAAEAGPAKARSGIPTPTHQTRLLPAVLVALVVSLAVAALWVAAAVQTDLVLPELAIVVGVAAGLVIRRSSRRGGLGAAASAIVVALVAISVGLALAALAVHSAGQGVTLQTGLQTFTSSVLPQLRDEIGAAGVALGVAGVLVAGLLTLRRD